MYELYTPLQKIYFFICGLIIVSSLVWITHVYFEARVINNKWVETFTTPEEYWSAVPKWKWSPIGEHNG